MDKNIHAHAKGSAHETPMVRLDIYNDEGIIAADLMLAETKTCLRDKANLHCSHYVKDKKNHNEMEVFDHSCKQQLCYQIK